METIVLQQPATYIIGKAKPEKFSMVCSTTRAVAGLSKWLIAAT